MADLYAVDLPANHMYLRLGDDEADLTEEEKLDIVKERVMDAFRTLVDSNLRKVV